jgi:hypothetical protein
VIYTIDSRIDFSCVFAGGVPTSVALVISDPLGTVTRYTWDDTPSDTLLHPSADTWSKAVDFTRPGAWKRVWVATDAGGGRWRSSVLRFDIGGDDGLR